jgi:hypothetical protein
MIRKTPADTRVAEWMRAEAGTGASIESGSHTWNPSWADLMKAAESKKKEMRFHELI